MANFAILVLSDTRSTGEKEDKCLPAIEGFLKGKGDDVVKTGICADEFGLIQKTLKEWVDAGDADVILTSGGTGVSPRDVTPEATRPLLDREIPGIPEAMRAESLKKTIHAVISRGLAGLIGDTLVINLPGSPKAAVENLEAVHKAIDHIVKKAKGDKSDCGENGGST
ncbi:MAG: MogA/MoaB family molybdenum cofactor biosynthesis protein [Nitrospinota bacterium]